MRKITFFKSMLVAIGLMVASVNASAQLLVENFDYTIGTVLTTTTSADPTTGWIGHNGAGTANIDVVTGLSFTGYAGSGIGGAANVDNNGEDVNKTFTTQSTGTIYVAFMLQTSSTNSAGYFFMLSSTPVSSTFNSRIFVNATGNGIGISASSTAPTSFITITPGTPVLVVIKHNFTTNTSDLFVLNSFSSTEPTTSSQNISETYANTGAVVIRQYNASQRQIIDGIRVGTTWADACAAPGNPKAATPTFSATPGNVITSQSISLSSTTSGASIYYTVDGTEPNNTGNGTLYSGTPVAVNSTTTIKAITYASGMDASSIATGMYIFPTEVADLATLRAASQTGFYKLTGEVYATFKSVAGKASYIQDATAGIMVYDGSGKITTAYNFGDGIKNMYCTLTLYFGTLELIPFNDPGTANSTGNTVTPKVITISDLNTGNYQGQLVTIKNVTITGTGNFAASTSYTINDGTAGKLRTAYTDLNYLTTAIPSVAQDITGVVYNFSATEIDLVPRSTADFSTSIATALNKSELNMNIVASNGKIAFTSVAGRTVEIYNSVGQRLISTKTVNGLNNILVSARGVVFVKVGNQTAKVVL